MKNPMRVPAAFECAAQLMIDDPLKHGKSEALGFRGGRSEEHTSELQSLMLSSYAVFCWKKKTTKPNHQDHPSNTDSRSHKRASHRQTTFTLNTQIAS